MGAAVTPDELRADFELACAALPADQRPNLDRLESGAYRVSWTKAMLAGFVMGFGHFCGGDATEPGQPE